MTHARPLESSASRPLPIHSSFIRTAILAINHDRMHSNPKTDLLTQQEIKKICKGFCWGVVSLRTMGFFYDDKLLSEIDSFLKWLTQWHDVKSFFEWLDKFSDPETEISLQDRIMYHRLKTFLHCALLLQSPEEFTGSPKKFVDILKLTEEELKEASDGLKLQRDEDAPSVQTAYLRNVSQLIAPVSEEKTTNTQDSKTENNQGLMFVDPHWAGNYSGTALFLYLDTFFALVKREKLTCKFTLDLSTRDHVFHLNCEPVDNVYILNDSARLLKGYSIDNPNNQSNDLAALVCAIGDVYEEEFKQHKTAPEHVNAPATNSVFLTTVLLCKKEDAAEVKQFVKKVRDELQVFMKFNMTKELGEHVVDSKNVIAHILYVDLSLFHELFKEGFYESLIEENKINILKQIDENWNILIKKVIYYRDYAALNKLLSLMPGKPLTDPIDFRMAFSDPKLDISTLNRVYNRYRHTREIQETILQTNLLTLACLTKDYQKAEWVLRTQRAILPKKQIAEFLMTAIEQSIRYCFGDKKWVHLFFRELHMHLSEEDYFKQLQNGLQVANAVKNDVVAQYLSKVTKNYIMMKSPAEEPMNHNAKKIDLDRRKSQPALPVTNHSMNRRLTQHEIQTVTRKDAKSEVKSRAIVRRSSSSFFIDPNAPTYSPSHSPSTSRSATPLGSPARAGTPLTSPSVRRRVQNFKDVKPASSRYKKPVKPDSSPNVVQNRFQFARRASSESTGGSQTSLSGSLRSTKVEFGG